jgi:hypothetical protein
MEMKVGKPEGERWFIYFGELWLKDIRPEFGVGVLSRWGYLRP